MAEKVVTVKGWLMLDARGKPLPLPICRKRGELLNEAFNAYALDEEHLLRDCGYRIVRATLTYEVPDNV